MSDTGILELADQIEAALTIDQELVEKTVATVAEVDATYTIDFEAADFESTDRVLALVYDVLPGWTINMKGKAWQPNGHWVCSLRKTSNRDSDELIGIGRGPTLPHSLFAALLRVIGQRGP
ncbi:MAG: hypothetical protein AAFY80_17200 [Pseudomonadota bacterium]